MEFKVGNVGGRPSDCDRARVDGDSVTPTSEGVSLIGRCRKCDALPMVVSAAACDGSAFGRVGRGSDHVAVEREVAHVSSALGDGEGV